MFLELHPILFAALIVTLPVLIMLGCLYFIFQRSAKRQLNKCIIQMEDAIREGHNPQRIIMENRKIEEYFDLLMALFIKEYKELDNPSIVQYPLIQDLVQAWVDKSTGTLTLRNNRHALKLAAMIDKQCMELVLVDINSFSYGDDHAYEFDGKDGTTMYLSNNDFIRAFIKTIRNYNPNHKAFFE